MENITRCGWCLSSDLYKKYHDEEWGVPVYAKSLDKDLIVTGFKRAALG